MNGYPDESILRKIKRWDGKDVTKMVNLIEESWNITYGAYQIKWINSKRYKLTLITGGWSGNESVMAAINKNKWFDMFYWQMSKRGGLHEYEIYEVKDANL